MLGRLVMEDGIGRILNALNEERKSKMVKVKNIHSDGHVIPGGALNKWKEYKGYAKSDKVICARCRKENAEHGGHVKKVGQDETNEWYIVPLCIKCNEDKSETEFSVDKDVMVLASDLKKL